MKKILIDTGVWMSYFGQRRADEYKKVEKAKELFNHLDASKSNYNVWYSERNWQELECADSRRALAKYSMLPSHILSQKFEKTPEIIDNIGTKMGNHKELDLEMEILEILPGEKQYRDRLIYADAILENCDFLIHEDPKDFNLLTEHAKKYGLVLIDQYSNDISGIINILSSANRTPGH